MRHEQSRGDFAEHIAYFVKRAMGDWIPISVLYHDVSSIQRERGLARSPEASMALGEHLLRELFDWGMVVGDLVEEEQRWRFERWQGDCAAWFEKIRAWCEASGRAPILGELGWLTSSDMAEPGAIPDVGFRKLDEQEEAEAEDRERVEKELFVTRLGEFEPAVQALIDEDAQSGEGEYPMGTYMILANVARWVMEGIGTDPARRLLDRVEQDFRHGTDVVRGLIAVGFIESSAFSGEAAEEALKPLMGPILMELVRVTNERGVIFGPQIRRIVDKFGLS